MSPFRNPMGQMAQKVRDISSLNQKFTDAIQHIANDLWDVDELVSRINQVETTLHQTQRTETRVQDDLSSFDGQVAAKRQMIQDRKEFLMGL